MKMTWKRRPFVKAGPGHILNERWEVKGYARYWEVVDRATGRRTPERKDCYIGSMKEARAEAERLATEEGACQT